jgi:imidazolonepropionase-like amidohydrolase
MVDMHSHLGVRPEPQLASTEDVTDIIAPLTPTMRAIDGFDPSDSVLPVVMSGGVTSSLILTGAQNLMSGQGFAIKLRSMPGLSVADMRIQVDTEPGAKLQRYMKMACGEVTDASSGSGRAKLSFVSFHILESQETVREPP